ncbi:peptide/nickel transport system ATP-binding protein [Actinacidiphila paucisporea]|uniref:Peptide/nickel transport system ATP-binding protein n=2 Tax=Actinacidiphila paucisporea TaxID=310782 RepID=A0A1M7NVH0_9ACTN|nr:peptide/nickel transport system ATP-binding protein [Actinacidiphila paucisporea]
MTKYPNGPQEHGSSSASPRDAQAERPQEPGARAVRPLVAVEDLRVSFRGARGVVVEAVRGVDLAIAPGECLAVVGESGSGKSVTARALVGLAGAGATVRAARLEADGRDLRGLDDRQWREIRGRRIGLMLQDALSSLDPVRTVGAEIAEALRVHRVVPRAEVGGRVVELLAQSRVPEPELRARQYPYQLSGGLRQRALIASAMAADPGVLIADEPTTALDVAVQAQILDLLAAKKAEGTAVLLISHDLAVVARLADRIAVMYRGVFVETGTAEQVLRAPSHPYTRQLLAAVPSAHAKGTRLSPWPGGRATAGGAWDGTGCAFADRCPLAVDLCREQQPPDVPAGGDAEAGAAGGEHRARCSRLDVPWPAPAAVAAGRGRGGDQRTVLEVSGVSKSFAGPDGVRRLAVDDVSFTLDAGETLGVLGESGSGKSTTAAVVLGLLEPDAGSVRVLGRPWSGRPESERRPVRSRVQLIHQDPLGSFDPRFTVERVISEALGTPGRRTVRRERARITELLRLVGLDPALAGRRPRQLSGGQRQRVAIARAIAPEPDIVVCDEPVSALDASVQAQILDLLADLQERLGMAMLFISHDLGVIHHTSDRVLVMRQGVVVESGRVEEVFLAPAHSYTRELLAALPRVDDPAAVPDKEVRTVSTAKAAAPAEPVAGDPPAGPTSPPPSTARTARKEAPLR